MPRNPTARRNGFTLIELVVVLAIILILLGLLLPAILQVRKSADASMCLNNLKQMALGMRNIHGTYGKFPPLVGTFPGNDLTKTNGTAHYYLLPYIEQDNVYKKGLDENGNSFVWHKGVWSADIPTFICPSDPNPPKNHLYKNWLATTNYAGNWLLFSKGGGRIQAITDGTSQTIMFTERYQMCNGNPTAWGYPGVYYWMPAFAYYSEGKFQERPSQEQCDPALPQGFHSRGVHVAIADGSARTIWNDISPQTWWYACTPQGGEVLGDDWDN